MTQPLSRLPSQPASAAQVADLAARLAVLLRGGAPLSALWTPLATVGPCRELCADLARRSATGESAAAVLLDLSGELPVLGLALRVAEGTGASLSTVLERLAAALRAQLAADRAVAEALTGPRATAAVLTALPLAAPLVAGLLGVPVVQVLLDAGPGRALLVAGAAAWTLGRAWVWWLVRRAARAGDDAARLPGGLSVAVVLDLVACVVEAGAAPWVAVAAVTDVLAARSHPAAELLSQVLAAGRQGLTEVAGRQGVTEAGGRQGVTEAGRRRGRLRTVRERLGSALVQPLWLARTTGAPPAVLLRAAADDVRQEHVHARRTAAARLSVQVLAPLGLCLLPAFMLLAVGPVVLGLLGGLGG